MTYAETDFLRDTNVSRETFADYKIWHELLVKWNRRINLVSQAALDDFWQRHALDSWQLCALTPKNAQKIIDLGSGAGFPGIALAIGCKAAGQGHVTMVEAAGKKTSFLRTIIRELQLPAAALSRRAENISPHAYDIITARAFAPLPKLLAYAQPFWREHTVGLFLKGETAAQELTQSAKSWTYQAQTYESQSSPQGRILKITGLSPKISE